MYGNARVANIATPATLIIAPVRLDAVFYDPPPISGLLGHLPKSLIINISIFKESLI